MNLFTTKLRRGATVAGGTFLGLGIVAMMAAPALACDTKIKGSSDCGDGNWVATFQVANDFRTDATIKSITLNGQSVDSVGDIVKGATAPKANGRDYTWITGTATESLGTPSAELVVELEWANGRHGTLTDSSSAKVDIPESGCKTETPPTTPPTTEPTTPPTTEPTTAPTTEPTTEPTAPPTTEVPLPTPSDTPSGEPTLPDEIFAVDCDSMTIGLDNTKGEIEYKLHFTPSTGAEKDLDIKAGEKKSVTFDASEGFSVKISIVAIFDGQTSEAETVTVPYETPADCSGEGGGLPVTGAAAGGIAGGAAVLLAAGAGLFVMARRRKVRFTA